MFLYLAHTNPPLDAPPPSAFAEWFAACWLGLVVLIVICVVLWALTEQRKLARAERRARSAA